MLTDKVYEQFEKALGAENVSRDPEVLKSYSWQPFLEIISVMEGWCPFRPALVALPSSTEEVHSVVKLCNKHGLQFKALSTGWGESGACSGPRTLC
ncbi:MAG: hypothetical protein SWK76_07285 [Actinomycetota bacterium]|nr:hypothetical protein [Actinomycetota bacterium]